MLGPLHSRAGGSDGAGASRLPRLVAVGVALLLLLASTVAAVPVATDDADAVTSSPVASAGAPAVGPIEQSPNTTARLVLPDDARTTSGFYTTQLDVGGAIGVESAAMHGRYSTVELREEFAAAETDERRRAVVLRTAEGIDARIDELTTRQREAVSAYVDGELSTDGLVRELVAIHTAARSLETTINQLYTYDRAVGEPVSTTEVSRLKARLVPLQGPVRSQLAAAAAGNTTAQRVYITAAESGLVLSTVTEGEFSTRYIREALYAGGFDDRFADKPISIDAFQNRMEELYPWVFTTDPPTDTVLTSAPYYLDAGVYGIAINHPQGTVSDRDLVVYYDATSEEVFYEIQRQDVTALPTEVVANVTSDGLRVTLRATHADGPLAVNVTNATTGEPVDATVELNDDPLGTTDADTLWTIAPHGTFVVTAETARGNVSATATNV